MAATRRKVGMRTDKVAITVRLRTPDGRVVDVPVGRDANALFFGFEAASDLLGPFYTAKKGIEEAYRLFARLKRLPPRKGIPLMLIVHTDWCETEVL
jgi:hypothetical protein